MAQTRIRAAYIRGGTSRALVFRRDDLPDPQGWPALFCAALGSPDAYGRQLDGMGGGTSSLSKVCVVGPPTHPDADVDYTFAQVSVTAQSVDFKGNCGNMASAIGPFAVDEGMVPAPADGPALVRIHNTNSGKIIHARFRVENGVAAVAGDVALPGVSGRGAAVELAFQNPAGTQGRGLWPAGGPVTALADAVASGSDGGAAAQATLIDCGLPAIFLRAADLGVCATASPDAIDADSALMARLEALRRAGAVAMGMAADADAAAGLVAVPKIALIGAPGDYTTLDGAAVAAGDYDLSVRMISAGQAHRAVPITGALALAAAAGVPGTLAHGAAGAGAAAGLLRLGTPSGVITVGAARDAHGTITEASVIRTQRRLMEGAVCIPAPA